MSEENTTVQEEPLSELVCDGDDAQNIREFFDHFNIEIPDYLDTSLKAFKTAIESKESINNNDPVLVSLQNQMRVNLCRAFIEHESPIFRDDIFKVVVDNSRKIAFAAFFDKDLEKECTEVTE